MKFRFNKRMSVLLLLSLVGLFGISNMQVSAANIDTNGYHAGDSPFGNQVVDYYKEVMKTDLALEMAETIEKFDMPEIAEQQKIVIREMSGIEIVITIERSIDQMLANIEKKKLNQSEDNEGDTILYVGGATIRYYKNKEAGNRIQYIQIGKDKVENEKSYRVAMSENLANSKRYPDIKAATKIDSKKQVSVKASIEQCKKKEPSKSQINERYIGSTKKEKKEKFNMVLFVGSAVTAVLMGAVIGWFAGRKKRQIH